jgi:hypothetical protein
MDIINLLQAAAHDKEILIITYHGGSQPGATREILPLVVTPEEVRARCYTSNAVKVFKINKIRICGKEQEQETYDQTLNEITSLDEGITPILNELSAAGWHIEYDGYEISLYDHFKNGKLRKTPKAGIHFHYENVRCPWYVFGPGLAAARTFGKICKAVALFKEQAIKYGPSVK